MANEEKGLDNLNKELASLGAQPQAKQKAKRVVRKRIITKKRKVVVAKARRKMAIARARLVPGNERLVVNKIDIKVLKPKEIRELILEPVNVSSVTKEIASNSNISINVHGGGVSGQAQAARSALAKVITKAAPTEVVRKMYMDYDRTLIVDDVRQVEPKKFKGPKARARFQKSYR
jgi:small subunit ribosomal protein S9